jgi:hypothetical protein
MPVVILRGGFFDSKVFTVTHEEASRPYLEVYDTISEPFTVHVYKKISLTDGGYIWCDNESIDVEIEKYNCTLCRGGD